MSDPVTNVEIEDVLSSIRRLVSEDARAKPKAASPKLDRLVLTPALRVQEDAAEREANSEAADQSAGPVLLTEPKFEPETGSDDHGESESLLDSVARTDSEDSARSSILTLNSVDRLDDEVPDEKGDTDNRLDLTAADDEQSDDARDVDQAEAADSGSADSANGVLAQLVEEEISRVLEEKDAEPAFLLEDEAFAPDQEVPVDEIVEAAVIDAEAETDAEAEVEAEPEAQAVAEAVVEDEPQANADDTVGEMPEPDHEPANHEPQSQSLETKIAALEQMVAQKDEDYDADGVSAAQAAFVHRPAETLEWQDREQSDDDAAQQEEPAVINDQPVSGPAPVDAPPTWFSEDAGMIDEDMLRDMVSEIVRHELQGALGERITRNVRKLVRREIHRVLMSQEYD